MFQFSNDRIKIGNHFDLNDVEVVEHLCLPLIDAGQSTFWPLWALSIFLVINLSAKICSLM